jgi:GNAT superfamily N-acetyltransferase
LTFTIRRATPADIPVIEQLVLAATRELSKQDYTSQQIEAALRGAMGVDSELIRDGTYFVIEEGNSIVASGGWSRRKALMGGDAGKAAATALLDPRTDAAKIRAFYVRPDRAGQGLGAMLLDHCEREAKRHGFSATELIATLPGQRLYIKYAYAPGQPFDYPLTDGLSFQLVPMRKELVAQDARGLTAAGASP